MPVFLDNTLNGLLRPELDGLKHLPVWTPALVAVAAALAVTALSTLARWRSHLPSPCVRDGNMPQEDAPGCLRQAKAELKGRQGETAVAAVLARAGLPALHDVIVRDAWGLTQVDHLVRLPDGIAVLETKAWRGTVTGRVRDRRWLQELGGGRVRRALRNPVMQNGRHVRAVRRVTGSGVPVCGLVVSAGAARFCGELEGAVVRLDGLAGWLRVGRAPACDVRRLDAAWRTLTALAARNGGLHASHLRQVRRAQQRAGAG